MLQYTTAALHPTLHCTTPCCTTLHFTASRDALCRGTHCAVLLCTTLHYALRHMPYSASYYTAPHCTAQRYALHATLHTTHHGALSAELHDAAYRTLHGTFVPHNTYPPHLVTPNSIDPDSSPSSPPLCDYTRHTDLCLPEEVTLIAVRTRLASADLLNVSGRWQKRS